MGQQGQHWRSGAGEDGVLGVGRNLLRVILPESQGWPGLGELPQSPVTWCHNARCPHLGHPLKGCSRVVYIKGYSLGIHFHECWLPETARPSSWWGQRHSTELLSLLSFCGPDFMWKTDQILTAAWTQEDPKCLLLALTGPSACDATRAFYCCVLPQTHWCQAPSWFSSQVPWFRNSGRAQWGQLFSASPYQELQLGWLSWGWGILLPMCFLHLHIWYPRQGWLEPGLRWDCHGGLTNGLHYWSLG